MQNIITETQNETWSLHTNTILEKSYFVVYRSMQGLGDVYDKK
jgi:hypothetical protein